MVDPKSGGRYADPGENDPISRERPAAPGALLYLAPRPWDSGTDQQVLEREIVEEIWETHQDCKVETPKQPLFDVLIQRQHAVQVVHFDGHGQTGWCCRQCGQDSPRRRSCPACGSSLLEERSCLLFENAHGKTHRLYPATLENTLAGHDIRLFFLSACFSGSITHGSLFNTVASALIRAGVPAVIGYQGPIPMQEAKQFCASFYQSLVAGHTLDQAMTAGRRLLYQSDQWFRPVLYRRQ